MRQSGSNSQILRKFELIHWYSFMTTEAKGLGSYLLQTAILMTSLYTLSYFSKQISFDGFTAVT